NEGYAAHTGDALVRHELCQEAIRLGHMLAELMPLEPEVLGLLALMELQASRAETRTDADGNLVLLADQDRSRWDRAGIARRLGAARLSSLARRARRFPPPARAMGRGGRRVPPRARARRQRPRAAVPRGPARGLRGGRRERALIGYSSRSQARWGGVCLARLTRGGGPYGLRRRDVPHRVRDRARRARAGARGTRLRVGVVPGAHAHPREPTEPLARRRRASPRLLVVLRPVRRADGGGRGDPAPQARDRHLPRRRARS